MNSESASSFRLLPLIATVATGCLMLGWFFCAGTGSISPNWLGVSAKAWLGVAIGLHLATWSAAGVVAYLSQGAPLAITTVASRSLLAMLVGSLVISGVLLVALIRLEAPAVEFDNDQEGAGNSTGYHINGPNIPRAPSRFALPIVRGRI